MSEAPEGARFEPGSICAALRPVLNDGRWSPHKESPDVTARTLREVMPLVDDEVIVRAMGIVADWFEFLQSIEDLPLDERVRLRQEHGNPGSELGHLGRWVAAQCGTADDRFQRVDE